MAGQPYSLEFTVSSVPGGHGRGAASAPQLRGRNRDARIVAAAHSRRDGRTTTNAAGCRVT